MSSVAAERLPRMDPGRLIIAGLLVVLAALAWMATAERMTGMDAGPGSELGTLGFFVSAWVVMMAAMMFPSIAPMVIAYSRIQRRRREAGRAVPKLGTAAFVAGYLISWTLFGLVSYVVFSVVAGLLEGEITWDGAGRYIAGAVLIGAAIYELTPAKDVCLRKCRTPLDFVLGYWREGHGGALRMGVDHGAWCVGCCWALMAALFALGVMSLLWMAVIAGLIAIEKMLPWRRAAGVGVTVVLAALGLAVAFAPDRVPGLTLPDEARAMDMGGMDRMEMAPGGATHKGEMRMEGGVSGRMGDRTGGRPMHDR